MRKKTLYRDWQACPFEMTCSAASEQCQHLVDASELSSRLQGPFFRPGETAQIDFQMAFETTLLADCRTRPDRQIPPPDRDRASIFCAFVQRAFFCNHPDCNPERIAKPAVGVVIDFYLPCATRQAWSKSGCRMLVRLAISRSG